MNCKTCGNPCQTSSVYCCFACELAYRARDKAHGDDANALVAAAYEAAAKYHDKFLMTRTGVDVEKVVASTEAIRALNSDNAKAALEAVQQEARAEAASQFATLLAALPDGEWETWTSCSFRRISRVGGGDGDVLCAVIQNSDGHPDLSWTEEECDAICGIVNGLRALIDKETTE